MEHVEESELLSCSVRGLDRRRTCKSQMVAAVNAITFGISVFVDDILIAHAMIITILLLLLQIFTYS